MTLRYVARALSSRKTKSSPLTEAGAMTRIKVWIQCQTHHADMKERGVQDGG